MKKLFKDIKIKLSNIIPIKIRFISFSLFLFMMGWGLGTDTYFSLYIKDIVGNSRGVTAIGAVLALSKLAFVIPIGKMNDHINVKYILSMGKILYVLSGIGFFLAGIFHSRFLLLITTILDGFANSTTFTSYRSYYGRKASKNDNTKIFGAYFSATFISEVIGSLIAAVLVNFLDLPYMYLFVVIFALISLVQDQNIQSIISRYHSKTRKQLIKSSKHQIKSSEEIDTSPHFFGKDGFLRTFMKECTSGDSLKSTWIILNKYPKNLYVALGSQFLTNFLNYVGFLFIPIISAQNNLSLSQIAIVFAAMKLPYVITIFLGKFGDKHNKKLLIAGILTIMAFLYILMGLSNSFPMILLLTFFISSGIAMLNPLTSALVNSYTHPKDKGAMSGVQDFASRLGDIFGVLGFGTLSSIIGLSKGFIVVGLCILGLSGYLLVKKLLTYKHREAESDFASEDLYHLNIPVIDAESDIKKD